MEVDETIIIDSVQDFYVFGQVLGCLSDKKVSIREQSMIGRLAVSMLVRTIEVLMLARLVFCRFRRLFENDCSRSEWCWRTSEDALSEVDKMSWAPIPSPKLQMNLF